MSEHGKQEQTPLHAVMAQNPYLQCPSSQQIASLRLIGAHCRMIEHLLTLPMLQWHSHTPSGHDPDETGSSLMDTLIVTETTKVLVATPNHSKHLSGNSSFPPLIICVNFVTSPSFTRNRPYMDKHQRKFWLMLHLSSW